MALANIEIIENERDGVCLDKDEYKTSHADMRWKCNVCKKVWLACYNNVYNCKSWCPNCASGRSEIYCRAILTELYPEYKFISCRPDFLLGEKGRNLELDMYCEELKLCLEYQGVQHAVFDKFMHGTEEKFKAQQDRDAFKAEKCKEHGIHLVCIPHTVNYRNPKELKAYIYDNTIEYIKKHNPDVQINLEYLKSDDISISSIKTKALVHTQKLVDKELAERNYSLPFDQRITDATVKIYVMCNVGHIFTTTLDTLRRKRPSGKKSGCYHCEPRAHGYSTEMYKNIVGLRMDNICVIRASDPKAQRKYRRITFECMTCEEEHIVDIREFDARWSKSEPICPKGCPNIAPNEEKRLQILEKVRGYYEIEEERDTPDETPEDKEKERGAPFQTYTDKEKVRNTLDETPEENEEIEKERSKVVVKVRPRLKKKKSKVEIEEEERGNPFQTPEEETENPFQPMLKKKKNKLAE
jgi:hypothetical protein